MNTRISAAILLWLTVVPASTIAAATGPSVNLIAQAAGPSALMSQGEIRKVDKEAGKITIKHGPLANLEMPAMTMVFRVKDPAMLDQVKEGDKVRFVASRENGAITVIQLEREK